MPVRGVKSRERPFEIREIYAARDKRIFRDINVVVNVDKIKPDDLRVNQERDEREGERDDEIFICFVKRFFGFRHFVVERQHLAGNEHGECSNRYVADAAFASEMLAFPLC